MTTETSGKNWKSRLNFAARLLAVLILGTFLVLSNEQRSAIAKVLRDPLSILGERSPGARGTAALRQTKNRHEKVLPTVEKLLEKSQVVSPEALANQPDVFAENGDAPPANDVVSPTEVADADTTPGFQPAPPPPVGNGGFFQITPGGGVTGGGGGGGSGCVKGDQCATPSDTTPIVSVPEPETWLMLLVGFFSLGAVMRAARLSMATLAAKRDLVGRQPHND